MTYSNYSTSMVDGVMESILDRICQIDGVACRDPKIPSALEYQFRLAKCYILYWVLTPDIYLPFEQRPRWFRKYITKFGQWRLNKKGDCAGRIFFMRRTHPELDKADHSLPYNSVLCRKEKQQFFNDLFKILRFNYFYSPNYTDEDRLKCICDLMGPQ